MVYITAIGGRVSIIYQEEGRILERVFDGKDWTETVVLQEGGGIGFTAQLVEGRILITDRDASKDDSMIVPVAEGHVLAVYQQQNTLGYREIYGKQVGGFKPFHNPGGIGRYGSRSFAATPQGLHGAFALRGIFGSRLLYRHWDGHRFYEASVAEGPHFHNVVLSLVDDAPRLCYMSGTVLYMCRLSDYGDTFAPAEILGDFEEGVVTKAAFLTDNLAVGGFVTNELLVDSKRNILTHKQQIAALHSLYMAVPAKSGPEQP